MNKKPQRTKLTCTKCNKPFSTHSTNRQLCHTCKPKCRDTHYFDAATKARLRAAADKVAQAEAKLAEAKAAELAVKLAAEVPPQEGI
jgi:hypothetical protein